MTVRAALDGDMAHKRTSPVRIGVIGCSGRVGKLLISDIQSGEWGPKVKLAGGTVRPRTEYKGDFFITEDADKLFDAADVVIDFTTPDVTAKTVWLAAKHHTPYIIGTTGLNAAQEQEIHDAARETAIVYAANMSIGVNLLAALVQQAAAKLGPDWDIEVLETHHRHKIDAPSGTALMLGKAAAAGRKIPLDDNADWTRHGQTGARTEGHLGFAVRRGGDVVGEHTVGFYAAGERLELSHMATDRKLFARGAIKAAIWAVDQPAGLYSMKDVLGL